MIRVAQGANAAALRPARIAASLIVPGKPVTQNDVRRMGHWSARSKATKRVAADTHAAMLEQWGPRSKWPRFTHPVRITIADQCRTGNLRDAEACAPTVKAIVDTLVRAEVIPDDTPQWVRATTYLAPVKTGTDAVVIGLHLAS